MYWSRVGDQVESLASGCQKTSPHNRSTIHTVVGFSYLTIFVEDGELVLANAMILGHSAYAKSPQILPIGFPQDLCLLMLKDPNGNFVKIAGPNTQALKKNK